MTDREIENFENNWRKLAEVKIAVSAHTLQGWKGQYGRMFRFYKRTMDSVDDLDRLDFALTFFQNCYHLKDWIPVMERIGKSDWNKKWEQFVSSNIEIKICRDICNGTKHLSITAPSIDKDFAIFREYNPFHRVLGTRSTEFTIYADGQKYSLPDLMFGCIKAWDYFIATELLTVS